VNKRIQLLLLLLMACTCLCGLFFISYTGQSRLLQSVARVRDAMTRQQLSQDFLTSILKAESAQRGYILTGGKVYLDPFHAAESEIPAALDRLGERYVADPLETRDLLRELRLNTGAKMGELRTTIELYDRGGLAPALAVVQTDEGEKATTRIRELVATLAQRDGLRVRDRPSPSSCSPLRRYSLHATCARRKPSTPSCTPRQRNCNGRSMSARRSCPNSRPICKM
jgi:CHASE3 domain sensor protein